MIPGLIVVVDRLDDGLAVLRTSDGQELMVKVGLLPPGTKAGAHLNIFFKVNSASARAGSQQARHLIAGIIKNKHARQDKRNN